ncbi:hypothetical protein U9M48_019823 [Paspalum notatum var. saurae]|uniref:Uncharacterized protein n=1 Tax=Paspalum notatum var. saurae TaxID=547442 RepID=A0AAQ3TEE2_PASNO
MDAPNRAVPTFSFLSMEFLASILLNINNVESLPDSLVIGPLVVSVPQIFTSGTHKGTNDQGDEWLSLVCVYAIFIRCVVRLSDSFRSNKCVPIYMDTVVPVVMAFVLLLVINLEYYILAPFPVSSVCFIVYICNKIRVKESSLQKRSSGSQDTDTKQSGVLVGASTDPPSTSTDGSGKNSKRIELQKTVVVPYFMLVFSALNGDGNPVMSHFLLFSCCVLWALALMYSRLATIIDNKDRALETALECIQMAYMVMLFITAHTLAAEWLGEVTALVCMPEVMAGLVWFSTLLHRDTKAAVKKATSETDNKDNTIFKVITLGAVLAGLLTTISTYALEEERELLAIWVTRATVACGTAGCMPYLSVWMISRWPESSTPSSDEVTRLLRFLANVCLTGACLLLFPLLADKTTLVGRLFGSDDFNLLNYLPGFYFTTAAAFFVKLIVAP